MAHTYTILVHALFSTKCRQPWLTPEIREETFGYLGGTLNELGGRSLLVNLKRRGVAYDPRYVFA